MATPSRARWAAAALSLVAVAVLLGAGPSVESGGAQLHPLPTLPHASRLGDLDQGDVNTVCNQDGVVPCVAANLVCDVSILFGGCGPAPVVSGVSDTAWLQELTNSYGSFAYNTTRAGLETALLGLNKTVDYTDTQAAYEAEAQLQATGGFDQYTVLAPVSAQTASVYLSFVSEVSAALNVSANEFAAKFGGGGAYASSSDGIVLGGQCASGSSGSPSCGVPYGGAGAFPTATFVGSPALIQVVYGGSQFEASCPSGHGFDFVNAVTNGSVGYADYAPGSLHTLPASGLYVVPVSAGLATSTGCSITGPGFVPIYNATPSISVGLCGKGATPTTACNPLTGLAASSSPFALTAIKGGQANDSLTATYGVPTGPFLYALTQELPTINMQAVNVATAYFLFLKEHFCGQNGTPGNYCVIPSDCVVPQPQWLMPPGVNGFGNESTQQIEAIFVALLNGLATFFDTPLNSTTYCQGHPVFGGFGGVSWPDLQVNITGSILTLPVGKQSPANYKTWDVGPSELWVWAWESTINVPLNTTFAIPEGDPLEAVVIPPPSLGGVASFPYVSYSLYGNETANGTLSSSPGAEIYITSCTVQGIAANPCPLVYNPLQGIVGNVTCPQGKFQCQPPPPPPSNGGSLPSLCSLPLLSSVCSLFGGTSSLIGEIALVVVVVVVLVVVVLAVVLVVKGVQFGRWALGSMRRKGGK